MKNATSLVLLMLVSCMVAQGETLHFKNGDRLTGEWVRVDAKEVIFKSEALGEVTIPTAKLQSFESSRTAMALLKGGRTVRGKLALSASGNWELDRGDAREPVAAKQIQAIYPQETFEKSVSKVHPRPWQGWKGTTSLGYSLLRGDARTNTLNVGLNATRHQPSLSGLPERFRTDVFVNALFSGSRSLDGNSTSTNTVSSGVRQDFLFTSTNFVFLLGQLDHISTQGLDLRQTYGTGVGRDLLHKPHVSLSFLGGTTVVQEAYQGDVYRQNAEGLLGQKSQIKLLPNVGVSTSLSFYPNITDGGQYRVEGNTVLSTKVTHHISFTTGLTDLYTSSTLSGYRKNTLTLATALAFGF
jgi:putative salt-induced outer membrane protein